MSTNLTADTVLSSIRACLPDGTERPALHEPSFTGNERLYVQQCLDTGWVSTAGPFVGRFEELLSELTGTHSVAVVNGTAALHICLKLAGVEPGDEVMLPTLTFVGTANAIDYCGGTPHFLDSDEKTLGIAPTLLEAWLRQIAERRAGACYNRLTGRRIKALIAVHTFGHPVDLDALSEICKTYDIVLVEDAAQAVGSLYKGKHVGAAGKLSALSFNGNKTITTGGGGAILTMDKTLAEHAHHLTTTAKVSHPWMPTHDQVAYNYRLPNINAALGCAQMEGLATAIVKKRTLAERYQQAFQAVPGLRVFSEPTFAKSNYWLNALLLDETNAQLRDVILELTNKHGVMTRSAWQLMHTLPMFKECPRMDLSAAENLASRLINIPSSASLVV